MATRAKAFSTYCTGCIHKLDVNAKILIALLQVGAELPSAVCYFKVDSKMCFPSIDILVTSSLRILYPSFPPSALLFFAFASWLSGIILFIIKYFLNDFTHYCTASSPLRGARSQ
jgi:hypothetical protein